MNTNISTQPPPSSTLWETPQYFFDALDKVFRFDLDAAASEANAKCDNYFSDEPGNSAFENDWVVES